MWPIGAWCCGDLPELVVCFAVFKSGGSEFFFKRFPVDIHIVAKGVERGIVVAQFHIDDAEKHHRVLW